MADKMNNGKICVTNKEHYNKQADYIQKKFNTN
jgi:hypothetical protein